jgi:hypothetical protein
VWRTSENRNARQRASGPTRCYCDCDCKCSAENWNGAWSNDDAYLWLVRKTECGRRGGGGGGGGWDGLSGGGKGGRAVLYGGSGEDKAGRGMGGCQGGVYPWW